MVITLVSADTNGDRNRVRLVKALKLATDMDLRWSVGIFRLVADGKPQSGIVVHSQADVEALIDEGWEVRVESSSATRMTIEFPAHHADLIRNFITAIGGKEA